MLTKKDLLQIEELMDKKLKESLGVMDQRLEKSLDTMDKRLKDSFKDFYENLLLPYFEHNEKDHREMKRDLEEIKEHVKDHEKRLQKVEAITSINN